MTTAALTESTTNLGLTLIEALGLPENVTKLVVTMEGGKAPLVECEYIAPKRVTDEGAEKFEKLKGRFRLVEISGTLDGAQGPELCRLSESASETLKRYGADASGAEAKAQRFIERLDEIINLLKRIEYRQARAETSASEILR